MDRRWIYILIIAIIGIICLFFIVESSTTIGSANVNINTFTSAIPDSYNIDEEGAKFLKIINRKTGEKIIITDLGKGDYIKTNISAKLDSLNAKEDVTLIKNTTVTAGEYKLPSIYFEANDKINQISYIKEYNHTFSIECRYFKDNATMAENVELILNGLKPDFKQKQD